VNFSYTPVNNFWQNQGYAWANGTVYVKNTERNLSTPLQFAREENITYGLAGSLVSLDPAPSYASPGNCSSITVRAITLVPNEQHLRASGNGNAMLALESTEFPPEVVVRATSLNITVSQRFPEKFRNALMESLNRSIETTNTTCGNMLPPVYTDRDVQLVFRPYPSYPHMTLILKTTEITIGAY